MSRISMSVDGLGSFDWNFSEQLDGWLNGLNESERNIAIKAMESSLLAQLSTLSQLVCACSTASNIRPLAEFVNRQVKVCEIVDEEIATFLARL